MLLACNTKNSRYNIKDSLNNDYDDCNDDPAKLIDYLNGIPKFVAY